MTTRPPLSPGVRLLVDFGPLAVFFAVNALTSGPQIGRVLISTSAFMLATGVAMAVSKWKSGSISPMLWISGALVLVFGGLTLYFHNEMLIKVKPTIVYSLFAAALGFGLLTGRPLLQSLLETAYPGLSDAGWRKLTISWAIFFVVMAVLNEVVWRNTSWDFWVNFKLFGAVPLTLLFAAANVPMLLRHGLHDGEAAVETAPPPQ
ncbi:MAG: septation protein A [Pseudomonadota bacterium]